MALYIEPTFSGADRELEYKLIFSKNLGDKWVLAANLNIEQEWEREEGITKKESVLEYLLGAAYRFTPNWSVGLEARQHTVYQGLSLKDTLGTAWFLGPNIHYGRGKWWATFTALPQIAGHPAGGGLNLTEHSASRQGSSPASISDRCAAERSSARRGSRKSQAIVRSRGRSAILARCADARCVMTSQ